MKKLDPNYKVPLTKIVKIEPHPNPVVERLEIAYVYDFPVIVGKNQYKVDDWIAYIPINSVLPSKIENFLFPPDSKIKLTKSRVKAAKIQQFVSQGMIIPWKDIQELCDLSDYDLETDLQEKLKIFKYYPPFKGLSNTPALNKEGKPRVKKNDNEFFKEYKGCTNIKWVPNCFEEDNDVWISEKCHGSLFRCGYVPYNPPEENPFYSKSKLDLVKHWIKNLFVKSYRYFKPLPPVIHPEFEFVIGSNTVQRQRKLDSPTWYGKDIYLEQAIKYDLQEKLKEFSGYVIYGEVIGPTVQKGFHYGLKNDERDLVVFDIMYQTRTDTKWLSLNEALEFTKKLGLKFVPILYQGKWNKELAESLSIGSSVYCPQQKVREGCVVKNNDILTLNRNKIKIINPAYLMKEASGETSDETEEVDDFQLTDEFLLEQ